MSVIPRTSSTLPHVVMMELATNESLPCLSTVALLLIYTAGRSVSLIFVHAAMQA